jgi:hypothetical protein
MSPLLPPDEARRVLADHLPDLRSCLADAVKRYHDERADAGPVSVRSRACLIHDFAAENAQARIDGRDGVVFVYREDGTLRCMVFNNEAIVRFKKLDRNRQISAIATGISRAWDSQEPIEGFPLATNLVAGYTLDEFGHLEQLLLVCSLHKRVLWAIDLDDVAGTATPVLDFGPQDDAPPSGRPTVKSNLDEGERDTETGNGS